MRQMKDLRFEKSQSQAGHRSPSRKDPLSDAIDKQQWGWDVHRGVSIPFWRLWAPERSRSWCQLHKSFQWISHPYSLTRCCVGTHIAMEPRSYDQIRWYCLDSWEDGTVDPPCRIDGGYCTPMCLQRGAVHAGVVTLWRINPSLFETLPRNLIKARRAIPNNLNLGFLTYSLFSTNESVTLDMIS